MIGQPHTEKCRTKITTRMENDPAHARRLEDNLTRRTEFANLEPGAAALSESRTRQDETGPPRESAKNGGASSTRWSRRGYAIDKRWQNHRGSQAATTTWCADWACVSSMNVPQTCTSTTATDITLSGQSTNGGDGVGRKIQSLPRGDR